MIAATEAVEASGESSSTLPRLEDARSLFDPYLPCDQTTLRRVYLRLALKYHPDKWPRHEQKAATELFQAISAVYEKLVKPHGRTLVKRVRSAVSAAAELGDVGELRKLLEINPARANEEEDDYIFPLMFAGKSGSVEAMDVLLAYGADLHAKTPLGWSTLFFAALNDQSKAVHWLVEKGMKVCNHVLMLAAYTGSAKGLEALVACYDGNVAELRTDSTVWVGGVGRTLLHLACEGMCNLKRDRPTSYVASVSQLLALGIPVGAVETKRRRSCLQNFIAEGEWQEQGFEQSPPHMQVLRMLCEHGADPTASDWQNESALTLAKGLGLQRVVEVLSESASIATEPVRSAL
eukprot:TRINITY_DN40550_c0_g1_i1.p1 TRINITY_DN40550_c0_g1~~TRINITY_DN40550_c0_g1_i1.p1  ORF type:complete len:369 (+),score=62.05 TRINITY_DN40550_c0_g1_i1:62-1108(+)